MPDDLSELESAITISTIARYRRPPIVEALVDIHVAFAGEPQLAAKTAMLDESSSYALRQPMVTTSWRMSASATDVEPGEQTLIGFRYDDKAAGRVVLVRFNGFTFSQQHPYPENGWADWTVEARRLWSKYANSFRDAVVTRLAVRYINRIVVDSDAKHSDHFLVGPRLPMDFGEYRNFLVRTELDVGGQIGATVVLTHAELQAEAGDRGRPFLLDLDISCSASEEISSPIVWDRLEQLHSLVAPIFEGSVTENTRRMYR